MRLRPLLFVAFTSWALVPTWSGDARLALLGGDAVVWAKRVALDPDDRARRRLGRLLFLGGVRLTSPDPAFGGFSALAVDGDRVTLLSDGGNVVRFRLGSDGRVTVPSFGELPGGPGTGWRKLDRDSEALVIDPATGTAWVAFERANEIWRYGPGLARAQASAWPVAMRRWPENGGAETLFRRRDGSFVAIQEGGRRRTATREALVWRRDPTRASRPVFRFRYRPPAGYDPSDAVELPDGRVLVLNRWYGLPARFANILVAIDGRAITPGAVVQGREIARLASPLISDNFEGVAATVERGRTIVWLVSDDNYNSLQRTLLLKFRLD